MSAETHHKHEYRPDIDGQRAIAVGIVVLFHAFPTLLPGGYVGVDVFFVISGYLISGILFSEMETGRYSILQFYYRRFRRIFPALILVMIASLLYGRFFIWPHQYLELAKEVAAGAGFVANFLFWSQSGYFDQSANLKPMLHLWSLGIEEQFYLVWPLLLFLVKGVPKSRLLGLILMLIVASFVYSLFALSDDPTGAFYSPLPRFWELLVGALIAALPRIEHGAHLRWRHACSLLGLGMIFASTFLFSEESPFPGTLALIPVVGSALILLAGPLAIINKSVLSRRAFVAIGLISYPLYLWHWPIFAFVRMQVSNPGWVVLTLAVLASLVLASLTYQSLEKRSRKVEAKVLFSRLTAAMAVVLVFSFCTFQFQLFMHPLTVKEKLQFPYETAELYRYKTCFLYPKTQDGDEFAPECMPAKKPNQASILIWGDSLGAQLYSGLKEMTDVKFVGRFVIVQRTAGSCPPGLALDHSDNGNCDSINASTRDYISKNHPDIVVLNARWLNNGREPEARLPEVVQFLKESAVKKVILFGPAPDWWPDLRQLLSASDLSDGVPERMELPPEAWTNTVSLDDRLKMIATATGADFVSVKEAFCQQKQCLVRVTDDVQTGLITSDHDHMTAAASRFLMNQPSVRAIFTSMMAD